MSDDDDDDDPFSSASLSAAIAAAAAANAAKKDVIYSEEYAELEDSDEEPDPILQQRLLEALQRQHTENCERTTSRIAATRTVYSKRLRRNIYATSWEHFGLDHKEGELPPAPLPTPPPSVDTDTETDTDAGGASGASGASGARRAVGAVGADGEDSFFFDDDNEDKMLHGEGVGDLHGGVGVGGSSKQEREKDERTDLNVASEMSVMEWLQQRRKKELPFLQREAMEREEREKAKLKMKKKKYRVMLPEEVRGSTANGTFLEVLLLLLLLLLRVVVGSGGQDQGCSRVEVGNETLKLTPPAVLLLLCIFFALAFLPSCLLAFFFFQSSTSFAAPFAVSRAKE